MTKPNTKTRNRKTARNCGSDKRCQCSADGRRMRAHLMASEFKRTMYEGRETLIVPIILARGDRVMNDALLPVDEMIPEAWNGVPVTVQHPDDNGEFLSANSPDARTEWSIGTMFNCAVIDNIALKGEAWIDVKRASNLMPDLITKIEAGEQIDVSTGYFSVADETPGTVNGATYSTVDRNVNPDHLAILPGVAGACSFADGCGIRSNNRGSIMANMENVLKALRKSIDDALSINDNTKGKINMAKRKTRNADELPQAIVELIENEASPFTEGDAEDLKAMTEGMLEKVMSMYAPDESANEDDEDDPIVNEGDDDEENANEDDEEMPAANRGLASHRKQKAKGRARRSILCNEDRFALLQARKLVKSQRNDAIPLLVANGWKATQLAKYSSEQILEMAENIRPVANFGGRPLPQGEVDDAIAKDMAPRGLVYHLNQKKSEAA